MPFDAPQFQNMGRTVISPQVIQSQPTANFWGGVWDAGAQSLFSMLPQLLGMDPAMIQAEAHKDQVKLQRDQWTRLKQQQDFEAMQADVITPEAYQSVYGPGKEGSPTNEWNITQGQNRPTQPGAPPPPGSQQQAPPPQQGGGSAPQGTGVEQGTPQGVPPITQEAISAPTPPVPSTQAEITARVQASRAPGMDPSFATDPSVQQFAQEAFKAGGPAAVAPAIKQMAPGPIDANDRPEIRYKPTKVASPEEQKELVAKNYRLGAALNVISQMNTPGGKFSPDDMRTAAATADELAEYDRLWRYKSGIFDPELDFMTQPENQAKVLNFNNALLGKGSPEENARAIQEMKDFQADWKSRGYSQSAFTVGSDIIMGRLQTHGPIYAQVMNANSNAQQVDLMEKAAIWQNKIGAVQAEVAEGTKDYMIDSAKYDVQLKKEQATFAAMAPEWKRWEMQHELLKTRLGYKVNMAQVNSSIAAANVRAVNSGSSGGATAADLLGKFHDVTGKMAEIDQQLWTATTAGGATKMITYITDPVTGAKRVNPASIASLPPAQQQRIMDLTEARDNIMQGQRILMGGINASQIKSEVTDILQDARANLVDQQDLEYIEELELMLQGFKKGPDGQPFIDPQSYQTKSGRLLDGSMTSALRQCGAYYAEQSGGKVPAFKDFLKTPLMSGSTETFQQRLISEGVTSTEDQEEYYNRFFRGSFPQLPEGYKQSTVLSGALDVAGTLGYKPKKYERPGKGARPGAAPAKPSVVPQIPKASGSAASQIMQKVGAEDPSSAKGAATLVGRLLKQSVGSEDRGMLEQAISAGAVEELSYAATTDNPNPQTYGYLFRGKDPVYRDVVTKSEWPFSKVRTKFKTKKEYQTYVELLHSGRISPDKDIFQKEPGLFNAATAFYGE